MGIVENVNNINKVSDDHITPLGPKPCRRPPHARNFQFGKYSKSIAPAIIMIALMEFLLLGGAIWSSLMTIT